MTPGMLRSLDWNLVVTARSGRRRDLASALRPIVRVKSAGFPEVMVGRTDDVEACLDAIAARADPAFRREILARVVPIGHTFTLDPDDLEEQLIGETRTVLDELVGHPFHVRVERRGHKGVVRTDLLERVLGTALVEALRARGDTPRVVFDDPDLVVAVELIGTVGGLALITRERRERHPFVRAV
jgi:tRNA(Ser,Leu) C12 N-acetylase TAN1